MKKEKRKSIFDDMPEDIGVTGKVEKYEKPVRKDGGKWKKINSVLDHIAGFIIAAVLVLGVAALCLEYKLVKGPSPTFSTMWINTIGETRRFDFVNNLFLTEEEVKAAIAPEVTPQLKVLSNVKTEAPVIQSAELNPDGVWTVGDHTDDDGDGIIYFEFKEAGSQCYMIAIQDPTRVFVGMPEIFGGNGLMLEDMINRYGARGGINAGGFVDNGGTGTGGMPDGITIVDFKEYNSQNIGCVCGIDDRGNMTIGDFEIEDCRALGFKYAVSFEPVLVLNSAPTYSWGESGSNPRTCIGQRADGTILMLTVDGRQFFSPGLNYEELAWIMIGYGAVNAINMDGGSSSCMMMDGDMKNNPTNAAGGSRYLPTAWLFK